MEKIDQTIDKRTREKLKHYIHILDAYLRGKTIYCRYIYNNGDMGIWSEVKKNNSKFDFINYEYIVFNANMRPYNDITEFCINYNGRRIRSKNANIFYKLICITNDGVILNSKNTHFYKTCSYKELLELFEYEDGSPIGIHLGY